MKWNEEIEQALLGTLIVNDKIYDLIAPNFNSAWFYNPVHSRIYDVISEMYEDGRTPAVPLLVKFFENDEDLKQVGGGAKYIQDLTGCFVSVQAAPEYAGEIYNHHISRMVEALSGRLMSISNDTIDADKKISQIEEIAFNLRTEKLGEIKSAAEAGADALSTIQQAQKGVKGIETDIPSLDRIIKRFQHSNLYIIAARPSVGKTALAATMAENIALNGKKVLFFSMEMTAGELRQRAIARMTGISVDEQKEKLSDEKLNQIVLAVSEMNNLPLWTDERPTHTVNAILSKARRHKRLHGLDIIFIDYLGLMMSDDLRINKVHQVEQITTRLKRIAKILKIPVVLLCQLSRGLVNRTDKRPILSDLRDSGAIEQDADMVMFVYREEMHIPLQPEKVKGGGKAQSDAITAWENKKEDAAGRAEIIVAKNRQGKTGVAHIRFDGVRQEFHDEK